MTSSRALPIALLALLAASRAWAVDPRSVMADGRLQPGFDLGIDTSGKERHWLSPETGFLHLVYPAGQQWGALFVTVGPPKDPPRPSRDFSAYGTLVVELRGGTGGEVVRVGIKDATDRDDGSEVTLPVTLTSEWVAYEFELTRFDSANLRALYVVTEIVFAGTASQTVDIRTVRFEPASTPPPVDDLTGSFRGKAVLTAGGASAAERIGFDLAIGGGAWRIGETSGVAYTGLSTVGAGVRTIALSESADTTTDLFARFTTLAPKRKIDPTMSRLVEFTGALRLNAARTRGRVVLKARIEGPKAGKVKVIGKSKSVTVR